MRKTGLRSHSSFSTGRSKVVSLLQFFFRASVVSYVGFILSLQLTLTISTSLISNKRLSRSENLVPA